MNFSVHLGDELVERLNRTAGQTGKKRNALIREAVGEWLSRHQPAEWPAEIVRFRGLRGLKRFEEDRKKLKPPRTPFDAISA
ncbi:MAG TPA: ribbon-helix-helix protein, CopG family [Candidatus Binataceae bacterium]|nr:ribbon-helix-helix protein, CopG family [Candidatus Binataceae bacterium]